MTKSKEQRRQEALEREQSNYCRYHFPDWISESPLGSLWSNLDLEVCLNDWINATDKLLRQAFACDVDIIGRHIPHVSAEVRRKQNAKMTVKFYLHEDMLEELLNEHVDFARTKCFKGGHHELDIYNAETRMKNIEAARELFDQLYPDVQLSYKEIAVLESKYNNKLVSPK